MRKNDSCVYEGWDTIQNTELESLGSVFILLREATKDYLKIQKSIELSSAADDDTAQVSL